MSEKQETTADISAWARGLVKPGETLNNTYELLNGLADRYEAAQKRERDSIHRAMVLIAGIEMEGSEAPPRLWTALEDAYDALSDALGTDGDATADMAEAEATGRHFVVKSSRNGAKMREALLKFVRAYEQPGSMASIEDMAKAYDLARAALAAPPRNCDAISEDALKEGLRKEFEEEVKKGLPITEEQKALIVEVATDTITSPYATYKEDEAEQEEGGAR